MKVNIDNLRIKLAKTYNVLANKCKDVTYDYPEDLYDDLEDMRNLIGALLLCYNDIDTKDVSDEVELESVYDD